MAARRDSPPRRAAIIFIAAVPHGLDLHHAQTAGGFLLHIRQSVYINGVSYKLGRLLYGPNRPEIADKPISRVCDGYYRQLNFSV